MKKNIALLISIVALILLILFLRVVIPKEHHGLNGTMINDAIYGYDLATESLDVNGLTVRNQEVYYLLMEVVDEEKSIYNYKLKKLDINKNKVTEINTLEQINNYCSLKEENVYCFTSNNFRVYDLALNEIFNYTSNTVNEISYYVPYKDIYVKIIDKDIYLIRNNNEEKYRTIESSNILFYDNYYVTEDNTYLILLDEEGTYYLYDINNNELTNTEKRNYLKYSNGLFFYDELNYEVYDLNHEEIITYENPTQENYYYSGTLNSENNTFYLYDVIDNKLYIENLANNTLQELDANIIAKNNPIANLILDDNYLYIHVLQDKDNFYCIDLEKLELESTNIKEYNNELINNINNKINEIKETYNVTINIKEDAIIKFPDFSAEPLINNEIILDSLNKIETILSKYDLEFFDSFYQNGFSGLNLYLTGSLTPSDYETQASNPAAYSLTFNGQYMIVIDLNQPNIEELLCHELLHNLEFNLNNQSIKIFNNWNKYNPKGFYYNNSYTKTPNYNYTLSEDDPQNVYFIDYYSHTYATEDRARVFERICSCNKDSIVNDYPKLYEKGLYLKEEIIKYYPNLANTGLFDSLN